MEIDILTKERKYRYTMTKYNPNMIVHDEVDFVSFTQEKSSIKIGTEVSTFSLTKFYHLPPLHRLKNKHSAFDSLKRSVRHKIRYLLGLDEPLIINLDGEDLSSLWDFLHEMKKVLHQSEKDILNIDLFSMRLNFNLYILETKFDFKDISFLVNLIKDDIIPKSILSSDTNLHDISIKMLEEIYSHWFTDICIIENCVTIAKLVCSRCHQKICSNKCQITHDKDKICHKDNKII